MRKIQLLFVFITIITFAQSKKIIINQPSLIQSITSDTAKGMFNQVIFSYDERNRVIGIVYKDLKIINDSIKKDSLIEKITKSQTFEYKGNVNQPYLRINFLYDYVEDSTNWQVTSIEKTYFLYRNEKRIGDSSLLIHNVDKTENFKWDDSNTVSTTVSKLEQSDTRIYQKDDFTNPSTGYPNIYINEFKLTRLKNIQYELVEHRYGGRGRNSEYLTFTKFDSRLNPLKNLNISNTLCNEKVSFYLTETNGSVNEAEEFKEINWYFFNQNNMVNYYKTFDEISSHYKDVFSLKYTYNQHNQPIYAKVLIQKVWHNNPSKQVNVLASHIKNFTFKYKKFAP